MRRTSVCIAFLLFVSIFSLTITIVPENAQGITLFVGGAGPGNYTTINEALSSANPGDTVYVYGGIYLEHLVIDKPLSLVGENRTSVVNGSGMSNVITITANWVNITGFTIVDSGRQWPSNIGSGILLKNVENCTVLDNYVGLSSAGIALRFSSSNSIVNNTVDWGTGIALGSSHGNDIIDNDLSLSFVGIGLGSSNLNTISGNNASSSYEGIRLVRSEYNNIYDNNASARSYGISLDRSNNNIIVNNTAFHSFYDGIVLDSSEANTLKGNILAEAGIYITGPYLENYDSHAINASNLVNGKPVHYWKNRTGGRIPDGAGQIIAVNCTGLYIENHDVRRASMGIQLISSARNFIANNTASLNSHDGIHLRDSDDNVLVGNTARGNTGYGILLYYSDNARVSGNDARYNDEADIHLFRSHSNTITDNLGGASLEESNYNVVADNIAHTVLRESHYNFVSNNSGGVTIWYSNYNTVYNNTAFNYAFSSGIRVRNSNNNSIINNTVSWCQGGVLVVYSEFNTFAGNTFSDSRFDGMYLSNSNGNWIYHNRFIDNGEQAYDNTGTNHWDNGYPSGGNYWSDYSGVDLFRGPNQNQPGKDGFGDSPYQIDSGIQDRYPFMTSFLFYLPRPPVILDATLTGNDFENVTLLWALSPDDGAGYDTVIGYQIRRGRNLHSSIGTSYQLVASLPNGMTSFLDASVGEGNPNDYFYQVCAVDHNNNVTCSKNQGGKFTHAVNKGRDLISIPLVQSDDRIEAVLQTVSFEEAWTYDSLLHRWTWNVKSKPYTGELKNLDHTMAVWLQTTEDSNLTVAGLVPLRAEINLRAGWNLVGYPSFDHFYTVGNLKAETNITEVEGFNPVRPWYFLRSMLDTDIMLAGNSYWIWVDTDSIWTVTNS
jgi:parallel beta-helix repeat protein